MYELLELKVEKRMVLKFLPVKKFMNTYFSVELISRIYRSRLHHLLRMLLCTMILPLFRKFFVQSHYSRPPPSSASFSSAGSGSAPDFNSHTADITPHTDQLGLQSPPFQGNLPLYQPTGSLGSWGSSPAPPTVNGSGLAVASPMPILWPGYYAPTGTLPHLQQSPLLRPPAGLSFPQSMQQPLQYLPEFPSFLPTVSSTLGSTSATMIPSTLPPLQPSSPAPEASFGANMSFVPHSSLELVASGSQHVPAMLSTTRSLVSNSNVSYQTMPQPASSMFGFSTSTHVEKPKANVSFLPHLASHSEPSATVSQNMLASVSPMVVPAPNVNYQITHQPVTSTVINTNPSQIETSVPLIIPDQLQSAPLVASSSQQLQARIRVEEVKPEESKTKPLLPEPPVPMRKEPILPLPTHTHQKPNRAVLHTHEISRGRGRGRGNWYPRPMTKFTEDFDFTAMNEKFNKDEVWGDLCKNKGQLRDAEGDIEEDADIVDEDGYEPSKSDSKPIYVKDDFFDTLSCNALDRGSSNGRPRFSEQLKIDAETFGNFSRYRHVRGGGGGFRGGRTHGYYGRGHGYSGRGRGQSGPYQPF
ncbi:uncharacterized protein A4U43_C04F2970 [Asparagus officinalis]|uniref:DFDF domain-containing protein n=1 Tax=Asparagus officinalis TaxID=4686 RepID=A0A5P1F2B1_ASPOF|nr:uncharacterized protein A4U43_C04F2970 [Asparagus officinalis]